MIIVWYNFDGIWCNAPITMVGQSGQKAPKVPRMKSFTLENIRVSKVSCIKRYAYQKFRV